MAESSSVTAISTASRSFRRAEGFSVVPQSVAMYDPIVPVHTPFHCRQLPHKASVNQAAMPSRPRVNVDAVLGHVVE